MSASTPLLENWPKWAQCVTCWDHTPHVDPTAHYGNQDFIMLPCCHCSCSRCYGNLWKGDQLTCPTCKRTFKTAVATEQDKIRPLEFIQLENVNKKRVCTLCIRKGVAVSFCPDCDKLLCRFCAEHHPFAVTTSSHTLAPLEADSDKTPLEKCSKHGEDMDSFCKACEIIICKECSCHGNHQVLSLEESIDHLKENVAFIVKNIGKSLQNMRQKQSQVDSRVNHLLTTEKEYLLQEARTQLAILFSKLLTKEMDLRKTITMDTFRAANNLKIKQLKCITELKSAFQYAHFLKSLISCKKGSTEYLKAYRLAKQQYTQQQQLLSKYMGNDGDEYFETGYHFHMDKTGCIDAEKKIQTFGKITYAYSPNSRIHKKLKEVSGPVIVSVSGSVGIEKPVEKVVVVEKRPALAKRTGGIKIPRGRQRNIIPIIESVTAIAQETITPPETIFNVNGDCDVQTLKKISLQNRPPPILTPPPMSPEEAIPMEIPELALTPQENLLSETLSMLASDFLKESETTPTCNKEGRKNSRKSQLSVIQREDEDILFEDEERGPPILKPEVGGRKPGRKSIKEEKNEVSEPELKTHIRSPGKREIKRKTLDKEFVTSQKYYPISTTFDDGVVKKKRRRRRKPLDPLKTSQDSDHEDYCGICRDGGEDLLCCDKCPKIFHPMCHIPSLSGIPEGEFLCNFCKPKEDACDPEKQPEKHFRSLDSTSIHADEKEFFKACKFLSQVFRLDNEWEIRVVVEGPGGVETCLKSPLYKIKEKLANDKEDGFKDSKELIAALEAVIKEYWELVRPRKTKEEIDRMKNFEEQFTQLVKEYYP